MRTLLSVLTLSLLSAAGVLAGPVASVQPGTLAGTPGATVGWGFTFTNTSDFALITSTQFCVGSSGIGTPCALSPLGTYTDFTGFNFVVAGPAPESTSVTQSFDAGALTGTGSFAISPAILGGGSSGQIVFTYDLFSVSPNDPSFDPDFDTISVDNQVAAPASLSVQTVPEPAAFLLAAPALALLALLRRRRA